MLDAHKQQASLLSEERSGATEESSLAEQLTYALGVVRRQFLVVIVLAIAGAAVGAVVLLKSPIKYTATATLLVDTRKIDILQQPTISSELSMQSTGAMESQIAFLKSNAIASAVISKLKLLDDPRFIGSGRPGTLTAILNRVRLDCFPIDPANRARARRAGSNSSRRASLRSASALLTQSKSSLRRVIPTSRRMSRTQSRKRISICSEHQHMKQGDARAIGSRLGCRNCEPRAKRPRGPWSNTRPNTTSSKLAVANWSTINGLPISSPS